jgi:hypothetical protein
VTGRGNNSPNGISPVRDAVVRVIASLRRRNIVDRYEEHTAGSFSIHLASIGAMIDAPHRRREREKPALTAPLPDLSAANRRMLRDLAERSLEGLGIKDTHAFLELEMQRQLRAIVAALGDAPDRDERIRKALRTALDQTV